MITRRKFIQTASSLAGATAASGILLTPRGAQAYAVSTSLRKFVDPMPLFGSDIPLAQKAPVQPYAGVDYYRLTAGVYRQRLHSDLPPSGTRLCGYADHRGNFSHLGGAVIASQGVPVRITFASALPASHILPFDTSVPSDTNPGGNRADRAAIHLHGGLVPWASDGGPFSWQSNPANAGGLQFGASVRPWLWDGTLNPDSTPHNVWDYYYPNLQSARLMWYHDHAMSITRLNAYAGVATGYLVQDALDNLVGGSLQSSFGIPYLGQPIVFQDKVFWNPASDPSYASYVTGAQPGDLWYPWFYDPAIWPVARGGVPPTPSAVPEFFGDTMLANGRVYPFHDVGVGRYRFRLLNACGARFLDLSFVQEDPAVPGEPLFARNNRPVPANVDVWQIGTEGGFLPRPVQLVAGGVALQPFIMAPAERADLIVDFKAAGKIILHNAAGAPFPGGAPIFDWYFGAKKTPVATAAGFGPNTRTIVQFRVAGGSPNSITVPPTIPVASIPTVPDLANGGLMVDAAAFATQFPGYTYDAKQIPERLTLNEVVEPAGFAQGVAGPTGRLLTLLGNTAFPAALPFGGLGIFYMEPPTEVVRYKTLRIWQVFNMTADAHPMHFHLFNVQVLSRRKINNNLGFASSAAPPLPNEMGFKETVTMYPGECTTIAALVEDPLPAPLYPRDANNRPQVPVTVGGVTVNSTLPFSPRLQTYGVNGDEYVWHCHILEHEEHDMMRPLVAS